MNGLRTVSIKDTRDQISNLVEQVAIAKKQFLITKFGKPKALLVPVSNKTKKIKKGEGLIASFGIWKDRSDIKDSAEWVSKMRTKWSSRYGKISG